MWISGVGGQPSVKLRTIGDVKGNFEETPAVFFDEFQTFSCLVPGLLKHPILFTVVAVN